MRRKRRWNVRFVLIDEFQIQFFNLNCNYRTFRASWGSRSAEFTWRIRRTRKRRKSNSCSTALTMETLRTRRFTAIFATISWRAFWKATTARYSRMDRPGAVRATQCRDQFCQNSSRGWKSTRGVYKRRRTTESFPTPSSTSLKPSVSRTTSDISSSSAIWRFTTRIFETCWTTTRRTTWSWRRTRRKASLLTRWADIRFRMWASASSCCWWEQKIEKLVPQWWMVWRSKRFKCVTISSIFSYRFQLEVRDRTAFSLLTSSKFQKRLTSREKTTTAWYVRESWTWWTWRVRSEQTKREQLVRGWRKRQK